MGKQTIKIIILTLTLAGTSLMCSIFTPSNNPTPSPEQKQATINSLQLTVSAIEKNAVTQTPVPTMGQAIPTMVKPASGSISGKVSFPSEGIPPLRVVAINTKTGEFYSTEVIDSGVYVLDEVPAGTYHVIAYPRDKASSAGAGGYSRAVLCGLTVNCTDHSLVDVEVRDGVDLTEIFPGDWYAPEGSFPPDPLE